MSDFVFDKGETSREEAAARDVPVRGDREGREAEIVNALRTVYDPEIPVNIYDLGLIYRIGLSEDGQDVTIDMTLTAPGCPVAGSMPSMVEHSVRGQAHAKDVTVNLVWDPPWDKDMMSEAARLELGFF